MTRILNTHGKNTHYINEVCQYRAGLTIPARVHFYTFLFFLYSDIPIALVQLVEKPPWIERDDKGILGFDIIDL